jgi:uncharacterized C2H2 Zn-finger protein
MVKPELSGVFIERGVYFRNPGTPSWRCPVCKKLYQKKIMCLYHIKKIHG